jgi:ketosteroid isomerase-like protein
MGHASVVADYYADDAVTLLADGTVSIGQEAIAAGLEAQMEGSPTATLTGAEMMVFDGLAVALGSYSIEAAPEGADPVAFSGSYLTAYSKESGDWKITAVVSNYDSPRPEGWAYNTDSSADPPEDEGTMTDLLNDFSAHFNMGHASVVAGYYSEDAITASGDEPMATGREGVVAGLETLFAENPGVHVTLHDVATIPLAEGWALDGGWFQLDASEGGDPIAAGSYLLLCKQDEDGSWKIHWEVSNMQPLAD